MLDGWEVSQVEHFCDESLRTKKERLFHLTLRLIRRDHAAEMTVRNIRRLSLAKQRDLLLKAYQCLNTREWTIFSRKFADLADKSVKVLDFPLKVPLASRPCVCAGITRAVARSL